MNTVQPIKDINIINDVADSLNENCVRDYVMFMTGIYSGLRISDILKLKVSDVKGKDHIYLHEMKTGKERTFQINPHLKKIFKEYVADMENWQYLFTSRKGRNKPITRVRAYQVFNKAADQFGLEHIGTHTLRKTFGYHFYQKYDNCEKLQKIFNHSSSNVTLEYIGIEHEEIDRMIKGMNFRRS
jgi:integrase